MNIETSTRQMAIEQIFRTRKKKKAGGSLSNAELQREWIKTGLRWADLQLGVRDLVQRRVLELHSGKGGVRLEVTPRGEREMASPPHDLLTVLTNWLKLERVKLRRRNAKPSSGFRRRRTNDQLK